MVGHRQRVRRFCCALLGDQPLDLLQQREWTWFPNFGFADRHLFAQVWNTAYLPLSSNSVFDRFGTTYNVSRVLSVATNSLNETAYENYSPLYLPSVYSMYIFAAFALATAAIVHTALYHGADIIKSARRMKVEEEDVHMRLMKKYPEVPDWWYLVFLLLAVGMSLAVALVSTSVKSPFRRMPLTPRRRAGIHDDAPVVGTAPLSRIWEPLRPSRWFYLRAHGNSGELRPDTPFSALALTSLHLARSKSTSQRNSSRVSLSLVNLSP